MTTEKAPRYRISVVWEGWRPLLDTEDAEEGFTERGEALDRAVLENTKTCLSEMNSVCWEILPLEDAIITVERMEDETVPDM